MSTFKIFASAVHSNWLRMQQEELYEAEDDERGLEAVYLAAFPEGTNPIYLTHTEHDCSCCKQFIRNIGRLVNIKNGVASTVWDGLEGVPYPYDHVAVAMRGYVLGRPIAGVFRTKEAQYGAEQTQQISTNAYVFTWNHFHGKVASRHLSATPAADAGPLNEMARVLQRGLHELKLEALDDVIELIQNKELYRGEEHLPIVSDFRAAMIKYRAMSIGVEKLFIWGNSGKYWARFRNTVIGTLVTDLSDGVEADRAIRSFESKVAPANYKRPTAAITPKMVSAAMSTVQQLQIEPSLDRRHARLSDVSVGNVLWVNNSSATMMKSALEGLLLKEATSAPKKQPDATDITIDEFLTCVAPSASSIECMVRSDLTSNFVSVTAPLYEDAPSIFKWNNGFAWSYDGNITDSIKERVKVAGGNVANAALRFSLAWSNYDDLDIHVVTPNGTHIYFYNKAGCLDVDMNAGSGRSRTPVENVSFRSVRDGKYVIMVDQYNRRETANVGFTIEIESAGKLHHLSYPAAVNGKVLAADVYVTNEVVNRIDPGPGVKFGGISIEKWGVKTEIWTPVSTIMYSPNFWDDQKIGNRHWFFILGGCANPEPTRGIYNEFLKSELDAHRKVFEVLGNKTKCPVVPEQLSGIGFSSTKPEKLAVRVQTVNSIRIYNIHF